MLKHDLYSQTVKRLARGGINDPTSQIIALAEEIEGYREKIYALEALLEEAHNHNRTDRNHEYHGITWLPNLGHGKELVDIMTELRKEGYVPDSFSFDPRTETDLCCIGFRFVKL